MTGSTLELKSAKSEDSFTPYCPPSEEKSHRAAPGFRLLPPTLLLPFRQPTLACPSPTTTTTLSSLPTPSPPPSTYIHHEDSTAARRARPPIGAIALDIADFPPRARPPPPPNLANLANLPAHLPNLPANLVASRPRPPPSRHFLLCLACGGGDVVARRPGLG